MLLNASNLYLKFNFGHTHDRWIVGNLTSQKYLMINFLIWRFYYVDRVQQLCKSLTRQKLDFLISIFDESESKHLNPLLVFLYLKPLYSFFLWIKFIFIWKARILDHLLVLIVTGSSESNKNWVKKWHGKGGDVINKVPPKKKKGTKDGTDKSGKEISGYFTHLDFLYKSKMDFFNWDSWKKF
jgi:hypothetical protein